MRCNVGGTERPIRLTVGIFLLGLAFFGGLPELGMWGLGVVGAIMLGTGVVGYCPAWTLFGINTCHTKPAERS